MRPWVMAAGKGGVGTTTLTALIGAEAGLAGFRTLLIDGCVGLPGLHRSFGMLDGHPGFVSLEDRKLDPEDLLLAASPNVWLVPGGGGTPEAPILSQGARLGLYRRISRLFDDFDLVVIDGGSTLDSVVPTTHLEPAGVWTVTIGERIAMAGAYALIKVIAASGYGVPLFPLFNRSDRGEAESLATSMNGAALRFLRSRLGPAGHFPSVPGLGALNRVSDVQLGVEAGAALSALLPRMISQSRESA